MTVRPVAQPPCRPPKGAKSGTFHWLRRELTGASEVALWDQGTWWWCGAVFGMSSQGTAKDGWRYVCECKKPAVKDE